MTRLKYFITLLSFLALCPGCNNGNVRATNSESVTYTEPLHLYSTSFSTGDSVPPIYTCDSTNISPELHWNHPLDSIASFALIMVDPDAPEGTWVHWIVYNIPAGDSTLKMHFPRDSTFANGTKQGFTSFQTIGYGGPCPPDGQHRYFFQLYALNMVLNVPAGLTKTQLVAAMQGHILAEADLMGHYIRKKNTN